MTSPYTEAYHAMLGVVEKREWYTPHMELGPQGWWIDCLLGREGKLLARRYRITYDEKTTTLTAMRRPALWRRRQLLAVTIAEGDDLREICARVAEAIEDDLRR